MKHSIKKKTDSSRDLPIFVKSFICLFDIVSVVCCAKSAERKCNMPGRIPSPKFFLE